MRRLLFVLAVLLLTVPSWAQVGSTHVPKELPKDIKDWIENQSCHPSWPPCVLKTDNALVEYDMYSNPAHPRTYDITHYRVRPRKVTGVFTTWAQQYKGREAIWYQDTTGKVAFHRAFVKKRGRWRELKRDSPEWIVSRGMALRVWAINSHIQTHGEDPASLTF